MKYPEANLSLGHARLPKEKVDAIVSRLHTPKRSLDTEQETAKELGGKQLTREEIDQMLERLANTEKNKEKTPDRQRTGAGREMGIVNTYAWINGRELRSRRRIADGNWY